MTSASPSLRTTAAWWCRSCTASRKKSLATLQGDWAGLVERARVRKLAPAEYANPTFTISNMGMMGVSHFTAIPTPGIAAILAIAANGPQGTPFTLTCDHRVLNGADVALYLGALKQTIEAPDAWMAQAVRQLNLSLRPLPRARTGVADPRRQLGLPRRRRRRRSRRRRLRARPGRPRHQGHDGQQRALPRRRMSVARLHPVQGLARSGGRHPQPRARCGNRRRWHATRRSSTGRRSKNIAAGCKPAAAKWRSRPTRA